MHMHVLFYLAPTSLVHMNDRSLFSLSFSLPLAWTFCTLSISLSCISFLWPKVFQPSYNRPRSIARVCTGTPARDAVPTQHAGTDRRHLLLPSQRTHTSSQGKINSRPKLPLLLLNRQWIAILQLPSSLSKGSEWWPAPHFHLTPPSESWAPNPSDFARRTDERRSCSRWLQPRWVDRLRQQYCEEKQGWFWRLEARDSSSVRPSPPLCLSSSSSSNNNYDELGEHKSFSLHTIVTSIGTYLVDMMSGRMILVGRAAVGPTTPDGIDMLGCLPSLGPSWSPHTKHPLWL